jgi:hypothetical protein
MEEQIDNIVENGQQVIVEQEPVHGGFRPLVILYVLGEDTVTERISYSKSANSPAWNSGRYTTRTLNEVTYQTIEV